MDEPKELLIKHFEKIVVGVFGAWLAACGYFFVATQPNEFKDNDKLQGYIDKVKVHFEHYQAELPKLEDPTNELANQLSPDRVASVDQFPSWIYHRRPNLIYSVAAGPVKVYPKHEAPVEFRIAEKGRGKVKLAWKPSSENLYVHIVSYDLLRKDAADGEFKPIATGIDGGKTEYEDTAVQPRSKYWYKIRETAAADLDDPVIKRDHTDLAPDRATLDGDETKEPAEMPQDMYISIDGGIANDPVANVVGNVQCKVWKWNGTLGKFVRKDYLKVEVNGKFGQKEKNVRDGGKPI